MPDKKSIMAFVLVAITVIIGLVLYPTVFGTVEDVGNIYREVTDFSTGTTTNLTISSGNLVLESAETAGVYDSTVWFYSDNPDYNQLNVSALVTNSSDSTTRVTFKTSSDDFSSVKNSQTFTVNNGSNSFDVSSFSGKYVKVVLDLSRSSTGVTSSEVEDFSFAGSRSGTPILLVNLVPLLFLAGVVVALATWLK